jgi:hypothetical protein
MYEHTYPNKRYQKTLEFLKQNVPPPASVLDLGVENPFSLIMQKEKYEVTNTRGEDLDLDTTAVLDTNVEVVTAFEIFEHLLAPFNVFGTLKQINW